MLVQLSPNFTLAEFTRSGTATRLGIDNTPNDDQIEALKRWCENIGEPLHANLGMVHILSGFRCPALNKAVGGKPTSQHIFGEAADIGISGVTNADIWRYIDEHITFDQVIAESLSENDGTDGWVHVSYKLGKCRSDAISIIDGHAMPGLHFA